MKSILFVLGLSLFLLSCGGNRQDAVSEFVSSKIGMEQFVSAISKSSWSFEEYKTQLKKKYKVVDEDEATCELKLSEDVHAKIELSKLYGRVSNLELTIIPKNHSYDFKELMEITSKLEKSLIKEIPSSFEENQRNTWESDKGRMLTLKSNPGDGSLSVHFSYNYSYLKEKLGDRILKYIRTNKGKKIILNEGDGYKGVPENKFWVVKEVIYLNEPKTTYSGKQAIKCPTGIGKNNMSFIYHASIDGTCIQFTGGQLVLGVNNPQSSAYNPEILRKGKSNYFFGLIPGMKIAVNSSGMAPYIQLVMHEYNVDEIPGLTEYISEISTLNEFENSAQKIKVINLKFEESFRF